MRKSRGLGPVPRDLRYAAWGWWLAIVFCGVFAGADVVNREWVSAAVMAAFLLLCVSQLGATCYRIGLRRAS